RLSRCPPGFSKGFYGHAQVSKHDLTDRGDRWPFTRGCPKTSSSPVPDASALVVHHMDSAVALNLKIDLVDPHRQEEKIKNGDPAILIDRKSTRLNSSHDQISYAVFCLKKKNY